MKAFTKFPPLLKNYYFIFGSLFFFWMCFVDSNDFVSQIQITQKLNQLQAEEQFYLEKKEQVLIDREEINTNPQLLEKFAREKYMMKKPSEDLYVIVEE